MPKLKKFYIYVLASKFYSTLLNECIIGNPPKCLNTRSLNCCALKLDTIPIHFSNQTYNLRWLILRPKRKFQKNSVKEFS